MNANKIIVYDNHDDPAILRKIGVRVLHEGSYVYVAGERWSVQRENGVYVLVQRAPESR